MKLEWLQLTTKPRTKQFIVYDSFSAYKPWKIKKIEMVVKHFEHLNALTTFVSR